MKYAALLIIGLLNCLWISAQNPQTDTIATDDDELEQWLETYATPVKTDSSQSVIKADSIMAQKADTPAVAVKDSVRVPDKKAQIDATVISNAFSKSKSLYAKKEKPDEKPRVTTVKNTEKTSIKTGGRTRETTVPRPIVPDLPIEMETLLSAEDSLIISNETRLDALANPLFMDWVSGLPPYRSKTLSGADSTIIAMRNNAKKDVSLTEPELFDYHISQLPKSSELNSKKLKHADADQLALNSERLKVNKNTSISIDLPDIPKWKAGARFQVQASQNYISPNWYKGGESNLAANLYAMGYCNYNNRKNIQWDNKIEWKLGANSTTSDTLRIVGVNDDLFRINSKLGVKAFKSFFYTAEFDFQTSLFNAYKPQTHIRTSAPFSPVRINLSLGIDYKYKNKLSVFVSPLSYKLVYVADTTRHESVADTETLPYLNGITDGTRSLNQLGALLRVGWEHRFNDYIEMEIKFSFFGNYVGQKKGIETDLEVIGNFQINRFLSAKVSLNPRFDSTVAPADGEKPKLQFRELISLGFNYVL